MVRRRAFLRSLAVGTGMALAGCSGDGDGTGTTTRTGTDTTPATRTDVPPPTATVTETEHPAPTATETPERPSSETPPSDSTATQRPTPVFDHFVTRDGTDFAVNGEPVVFSGGNHPQLSKVGGITPTTWVSTWRGAVPTLNVLRVPFFGEGQPNYLQPAPGEYNEAAFELLDRIVYRAGQRGVRLVPFLANNWSWRGGMPQYVEWADKASTHEDFYTNEQIRTWYTDFVETVLTRTNTYTGIEYRNDPTIMLWELANEPRLYTDTDILVDWAKDVSGFIRSIDSNHLVSSGLGGGQVYDVPQHYYEINRLDTIDAWSSHIWADPQHQGVGVEGGVEWITNHAKAAHEDVGVPYYAGEFGWTVTRDDDVPDAEELRKRNEAFGAWYDAMLSTGTNAAMVWDLRVPAEYPLAWNDYAVFPRDDGTVTIIGNHSEQLTGNADSS